MRILHLISHFDFGGAENQLADLVSAQSACGHHVVVAAQRGRRCADLPPGVRFFPTRFAPLLRSLTVHRLRKLIREERVDLIHAHQREPSITGALLSRGTRTPYVVTLHSQFDWDLDLEWVRHHIGCLIVVSESWARTVRRFDEDLSARTHIVPNGIAAPLMVGARAPQRILYASRIDRFHARTLALLITETVPRIAEGFDEVELVIAGDGTHFRKIGQLARKTNEALGCRAVLMAGYQGGIAPRCAEAGLVLGVGRVALEGLAQAAPVLLVNDVHLGSVVTADTLDKSIYTNFVPVQAPPPDGATLTAEISHALLHYERNCAHAKELCTHVRARFDMNSILAATERVYEHALKTDT